jgi:rhodanese-related sulfurtransferase
MKQILLICSLLFSTYAVAEQANATTVTKAKSVKEMTPKELFGLIEEDVDDLYILDIREPDQVGHGEIFHLNLVKITRGYLEFKVEKHIADKNARIVIYCCTGKRGRLAAKTLQEMGYTNAYSLQNGIRGWVESGYPLDTVYGEVVLKDSTKK